MESYGHKRKQTSVSLLPSRNKKFAQWFGGVPQMQSAQADRWFTASWSDRAAWHLKQPV
jgi:hypothetical protein